MPVKPLCPKLEIDAEGAVGEGREVSAGGLSNPPPRRLSSGLNSLDSDFKPYFIGGVMFSWNFGQLNTSKNNKRLVRVQQEQVDMLRKSFEFNTRMEVAMQDAEIRKLREMLEKDEEVIRIRKDILASSEMKYSNGVYTISELITDVNQLFIAEQEKALREIELQMTIYSRMITLGIE